MVEDVEELARNFAVSAHGDQQYGSRPYVVHLTAVRAVLADFGFGRSDYGTAAWLHDVLEDTKVTAELMEMTFGPAVTKLVWSVTGVGKNRKERNECAYSRLEEHPRAIILKLADRIANAEACAKTHDHRLEMYVRESPGFKGRLERLGKLIDETAVAALMWGEARSHVQSLIARCLAGRRSMASTTLPAFLPLNQARQTKSELFAGLNPFEVTVLDTIAHGGSIFGGTTSKNVVMTYTLTKRNARGRYEIVEKGDAVRTLVRQGWLRFAPMIGETSGYYFQTEACIRLWSVLGR